MKSDCPYFRPMPNTPEVCAKWVRPVTGPDRTPFCMAEEQCQSLGLRLAPRLDQESDSEE